MERYKIIRPVGRGTFGAAMLVEDVTDSRKYVMKQIDVSTMTDKERSAADNEVSVLRSLKHPNIIYYRESFVHDGFLCIVMEYADAGDLSLVLKERKGKLLEEDTVMDWFAQICLGLKHIHDRHVLHRDLKAQNVFLTKAGIVKIGDFGISKRLNNTNELARTAIGTPYYLSPEICREKRYNFKSDIWSLGCVLYEMCAQKHAFQGSDMRQLVVRILKGSFPPVSKTYTKPVHDLIAECLQSDPKKRPSVNAILMKPFVKSRVQRLMAAATAYTQVPGPMAGAGAISSEPLTVLDEEDESDEGDDRGVDDIAASVITAIHSAPAVPAEDVVSPSLQARRDMAKGIADRIQKLADEIAGYQFPKQDTKPSEKRVDVPAAGAGKPVRRPSHIDVLREEVAYGGSSGAAVSSAVAAVKTSVSNSKPSPIHLSSAAQAPSQPAKASPVRPHRGHQSSRPPPLQPVEPAKDTFDPSLQDEIAHYMRTSPDAGTAPDPDNDVIIRARVRTNARRAASTNDLHSPAIVPPKHTQATKPSTVEAPKPAVIVDESPKPSPRKVLPPTAAAAAREKLAGKTAALRRRRVTDQARDFNENMKQLWSAVGMASPMVPARQVVHEEAVVPPKPNPTTPRRRSVGRPPSAGEVKAPATAPKPSRNPAMSLQQFLKIQRESLGAGAAPADPDPKRVNQRLFHKLSGEVKPSRASVGPVPQSRRSSVSSNDDSAAQRQDVNRIRSAAPAGVQRLVDADKALAAKRMSIRPAYDKPRVAVQASEADGADSAAAAAARKQARERAQQELRDQIKASRQKIAREGKKEDDIIVYVPNSPPPVPKRPHPVIAGPSGTQSSASSESIDAGKQRIEHGRRAGSEKPLVTQSLQEPPKVKPQPPQPALTEADVKRLAREKLREEMREAIRRDKHKKRPSADFSDDVTGGGVEFQVFAPAFPPKPAPRQIALLSAPPVASPNTSSDYSDDSPQQGQDRRRVASGWKNIQSQHSTLQASGTVFAGLDNSPGDSLHTTFMLSDDSIGGHTHRAGEPCTCPQSLVDARRVWGSVHRPSDDALTSLVASTVTTPKASPPPRLSMPSQPDNRSVLATVGSITIAGQPLQSADPALANVLSRAVGMLPSAASAHHKVEALRMHLEQQLGLRTLVAAHKAIQRSESGLASEAEVDEELLSIVGYHNLSAIPALRQLVGAEESLGMST